MDVKISPIFHIRYKDHVLFQKAEPNLYRPVVREAIGWLVREDDEAIWILWDKSVKNVSHERKSAESGLVILKSDIIEMRNIA